MVLPNLLPEDVSRKYMYLASIPASNNLISQLLALDSTVVKTTLKPQVQNPAEINEQQDEGSPKNWRDHMVVNPRLR